MAENTGSEPIALFQAIIEIDKKQSTDKLIEQLNGIFKDIDKWLEDHAAEFNLTVDDKNAFKKLATAITGVQDKFDKASESISNDLDFTKEIQELQNAVKTLEKNFTSLTDVLIDVATSLKTISEKANLGDIEKKVDNTSSAIGNLKKNIDAAKKSLDETVTKLKTMKSTDAGFKQQGEEVKRLRSQLGTLITQYQGFAGTDVEPLDKEYSASVVNASNVLRDLGLVAKQTTESINNLNKTPIKPKEDTTAKSKLTTNGAKWLAKYTESDKQVKKYEGQKASSQSLLDAVYNSNFSVKTMPKWGEVTDKANELVEAQKRLKETEPTAENYTKIREEVVRLEVEFTKLIEKYQSGKTNKKTALDLKLSDGTNGSIVQDGKTLTLDQIAENDIKKVKDELSRTSFNLDQARQQRTLDADQFRQAENKTIAQYYQEIEAAKKLENALDNLDDAEPKPAEPPEQKPTDTPEPNSDNTTKIVTEQEKLQQEYDETTKKLEQLIKLQSKDYSLDKLGNKFTKTQLFDRAQSFGKNYKEMRLYYNQVPKDLMLNMTKFYKAYLSSGGKKPLKASTDYGDFELTDDYQEGLTLLEEENKLATKTIAQLQVRKKELEEILHTTQDINTEEGKPSQEIKVSETLLNNIKELIRLKEILNSKDDKNIPADFNTRGTTAIDNIDNELGKGIGSQAYNSVFAQNETDALKIAQQLLIQNHLLENQGAQGTTENEADKQKAISKTNEELQEAIDLQKMFNEAKVPKYKQYSIDEVDDIDTSLLDLSKTELNGNEEAMLQAKEKNKLVHDYIKQIDVINNKLENSNNLSKEQIDDLYAQKDLLEHQIKDLAVFIKYKDGTSYDSKEYIDNIKDKINLKKKIAYASSGYDTSEEMDTANGNKLAEIKWNLAHASVLDDEFDFSVKTYMSNYDNLIKLLEKPIENKEQIKSIRAEMQAFESGIDVSAIKERITTYIKWEAVQDKLISNLEKIGQLGQEKDMFGNDDITLDSDKGTFTNDELKERIRIFEALIELKKILGDSGINAPVLGSSLLTKDVIEHYMQMDLQKLNPPPVPEPEPLKPPEEKHDAQTVTENEERKKSAIEETNAERREGIELTEQLNALDNTPKADTPTTDTNPTTEETKQDLSEENQAVSQLKKSLDELIQDFKDKNQLITDEATLMETSAQKEVEALDTVIQKVLDLKGHLDEVDKMEVHIGVDNKTTENQDNSSASNSTHSSSQNNSSSHNQDDSGSTTKDTVIKTTAIDENIKTLDQWQQVTEATRQSVNEIVATLGDPKQFNINEQVSTTTKGFQTLYTIVGKTGDEISKYYAKLNDNNELVLTKKNTQLATGFTDTQNDIKNAEKNEKVLDEYIQKAQKLKDTFINNNIEPIDIDSSSYQAVISQIDTLIDKMSKLKEQDLKAINIDLEIPSITSSLEEAKNQMNLYTQEMNKYSKYADMSSFNKNNIFIQNEKDSTDKISAYKDAVTQVEAKFKDLQDAIEVMTHSSDQNIEDATKKVIILREELEQLQKDALSNRYNKVNTTGTFKGEIIDGVNIDPNSDIKTQLKTLASSMQEGEFVTYAYNDSTQQLEAQLKTTDNTIKKVTISYDKLTNTVRKLISSEKPLKESQKAGIDTNEKEINSYLNTLDKIRIKFKNTNVAPEQILGTNYEKILKDLEAVINKLQLLKTTNKGIENKDILNSEINTIRQQIAQYTKATNLSKFDNNLAIIDSEKASTDKIDAYGVAVENVHKAYDDLTQAIDFMQRATSEDIDKATVKVALLRKQLEEAQRDALSEKYNKTNDNGKYYGEVISENDLGFTDNSISKNLKDMALSLDEGSLESSKYNARTKTLTVTLKTHDKTLKTVTLTYDKQTNATRKAYGAETEYLSNSQKFVQHFKLKINQVLQYVGAIGLVTSAIQALKQGITIVNEIDKALTNLKKVTDEVDSTYKSFVQTMSEVASQIGSTTKDLIESSATWARLGYSIQEAGELAKNTAIYMNVSDIQDATTATQYLISTLKAYGGQVGDSLGIVDKFNEVSNNFAITSEGLGEALTRSAASLVAAGNDINESIGLITAGNIISQDPENVGNAIKVLSLRIRSAKTDLEAMSEETDGLASSTSKLREEIIGLTGVDIMLDDKTFKSTYQIMLEISKVWDKLSDVSQANVLERLAGKTRSAVVAGLLQQMQTAEDVVETAKNSSGSALKENEKYLNSIAGKMELFTAAIQKMWSDTIKSDTVKGFIDLGTQVINLIDKFGLLQSVLTATFSVLAIKNIGKSNDFALCGCESTMHKLPNCWKVLTTPYYNVA